MPLPKGINACPTMAEEWVADRREKLAEFDRLVGKGIPECKAARSMGLTRAHLKSMRLSVERMDEGRPAGRGCGTHIDLGLAILSCLRKPGEEMTSEDIAAWCGCTPSAIQSIERRALAKVRLRLVRIAREEDLADETNALLGRLAEAA